jgi:hypothetical protein
MTLGPLAGSHAWSSVAPGDGSAGAVESGSLMLMAPLDPLISTRAKPSARVARSHCFTVFILETS